MRIQFCSPSLQSYAYNIGIHSINHIDPSAGPALWQDMTPDLECSEPSVEARQEDESSQYVMIGIAKEEAPKEIELKTGSRIPSESG